MRFLNLVFNKILTKVFVVVFQSKIKFTKICKNAKFINFIVLFYSTYLIFKKKNVSFCLIFININISIKRLLPFTNYAKIK